jgi:hypothetical protein
MSQSVRASRGTLRARADPVYREAMKRNSLAGAGTLAVIATFAIVLIAGPASQGASKAKAGPDCPKNALCLWDEEDYKGQRVVVKATKLSNKVFNKMNDLASSAFLNRKDRVAELFADANGGGESICLYEDNRWRINKIGAPFDDAISSTRVKKSLPPSCFL